VSRLEVQALSVLRGERRVVSDVSFGVDDGELWALLGPNGAGKSTLLRGCLGLLPAAEGRVRLEGRDVASYGRAELAREVAWVPQEVDAESGFTGLELAVMGRSPHLSGWGVPQASDLSKAREALEELGVAHLAGRRLQEMSGGERRLITLARALVQTPKLLLLDEPTAFLDLRHQFEVLARVRARVDAGLAVVAVLHDVNLAATFADRLLLLREGKVLAAGGREVLSAANLEALYGIPIACAQSATGQPLFAPRAP
jgi:iron complex transport system ATP-binding protein